MHYTNFCTRFALITGTQASPPTVNVDQKRSSVWVENKNAEIQIKMEIKIRYTWRQIKTGEIKQRVEYLENLECGELLKEGVFMNPLWELIARDLWTGRQDANWKDVYVGDTIRIFWESGYTDEVVSYDPVYGYFKYGNNPMCELLDPIVEIEVTGNIHINQIKEDTNG